MEDEPVHIRMICPGEEQGVSELVARVFMAEVAPLFNPEGIETFMAFIHPDHLVRLQAAAEEILLAEVGDCLAGMIALREGRHISLLFVDRPFQFQGIARKLVGYGIRLCLAQHPDLSELTVHASPNSVSFYAHLGFIPGSGMTVRNGIRYTPMFLPRGTFPMLLPDS